MKNLWSVILALTLLCSCSGGPKYPKGKTSRSYHVKKSKPKTAKKQVMDRKINPDDLDAIDGSTIDNEGQYIGYFKIGNPYDIEGLEYVPQDYEDFEETGTASWYGDQFNGKKTANGEYYNMHSMTAAHPTLPLPSLVRVTNLRNGKSVIARVNDRGPFSKNRVIDVSEKAAIALDFKNKGTTEVKVEFLKTETDKLLEKLKIKN